MREQDIEVRITLRQHRTIYGDHGDSAMIAEAVDRTIEDLLFALRSIGVEDEFEVVEDRGWIV